CTQGYPMRITLRDGKTVEVPQTTLVGAYLPSINLQDADLNGIRAVRANLFWGIFAHTDLSDANFNDAILAEADFHVTHATQCRFQRATLADATLTAGWFHQADFSGAILYGADVSCADFTEAMLCGADMRCQNLHDAILTDVIYDAHTLWPDGFDIHEHI
ncbi:MAG: pentapeptide repeat-containing protein, partial [Chloroflexota bacterium]